MAERVSFPIKDGDLNHGYANVYQRVLVTKPMSKSFNFRYQGHDILESPESTIRMGPPKRGALSLAQNEKGEGAEDSEKVEKESKDKDKSRVLVFDP